MERRKEAKVMVTGSGKNVSRKCVKGEKLVQKLVEEKYFLNTKNQILIEIQREQLFHCDL